ncbi:GerMN domain-containing protein [Candidatus Uhrbacteria bacterium]|nr:GerMN domain-containing protein [Candidatus Uhrbacteria bacterium]
MKHAILRINIMALLILFLTSILAPQLKVRPEPPQLPQPKPPIEYRPIRVLTPTPNMDVYSPLTIRGEARGFWFFEGSFPVRIVDSSGKELGQTIAQSSADWMTDDYIPFEATLQFSTPKTSGPLTLILEKDNPSGLPQHADSIKIPLQFKDNYNWVKVYFQNEKKNPNVIDCAKVFPVMRPVPKAEKAIARAALGHLIGGPDEAELSYGYFTAIPADAGINKLTIVNGVAYADFNDRFNFQVGGSCQIATIRAQVEETLKQFPSVKSVVISVNGQTELILEP